jgi:hypothetical protein
MTPEVTTLANGSNGSLAAVGKSLVNVGSASKAFVFAHPTTMAVAGGVLLGVGAYYALGKVFRKKKISTENNAAEVVPTAA